MFTVQFATEVIIMAYCCKGLIEIIFKLLLSLLHCVRNLSISFFFHCSLNEKITLNRATAPCQEYEGSKIKTMHNYYVQAYLNGSKGGSMPVECKNVKNIPCMLPQVKNMLRPDEQKGLGQCSTWSQYVCMRARIGVGRWKGYVNSHKKCTTRSISINSQDDYDFKPTVRDI